MPSQKRRDRDDDRYDRHYRKGGNALYRKGGTKKRRGGKHRRRTMRQ
jgi:hypothetical protein